MLLHWYCILINSAFKKEPSTQNMSSYLVTGCSRGLGLELVKQLLLARSSSVSNVIATSRSPSPSTALEEQIRSSRGRLHYIQLDVVNKDNVQSAFQHASQILQGQGLDVLINNAGITAFEKDGASAMFALQGILETNVVGVHNVSSAFLPLLQKGREKKIVNISSTVGSMALNEYTKSIPAYSYKISKTALNMLTIQYSNDLGPKGFTVYCVSPGWLRTELGGPGANLDPDVGAKATLDIIYNSSKADNGVFRNIYVEGEQMYNGENAPW